MRIEDEFDNNDVIKVQYTYKMNISLCIAVLESASFTTEQIVLPD